METQLYPLIKKVPLSVDKVTVQKVVDFAAFGVHCLDFAAETFFICFKSSAFKKGYLKRVDSEDLFKVLIILVKIRILRLIALLTRLLCCIST